MFETQQQSAQAPWLEQRAEASPGALLGQTMTLVAFALIVFASGAILGRDLTQGTAFAFSIGGFVMLMAQNFVGALRVGTLGTAWLFLVAGAIGLGIGPALASQLAFNPDVVAEAGLMTALVTVSAGLYGTFTARDLARWLRPLSLVLFATVLVSWAMLAFGEGGNPIISGAIGLFSAAMIVMYFNYLRRHAEETDVVWLATGIFVAIINLFISLLNLLSND